MRYIVAICGSLVALAGWLFVSYGTARTSIQVMDTWVRVTTGSSAVVHAIIANRGVNKDRLVRLSSGFAKKLVVLDKDGHEIQGLRIPAGCELVLGGDLVSLGAFGLNQA